MDEIIDLPTTGPAQQLYTTSDANSTLVKLILVVGTFISYILGVQPLTETKSAKGISLFFVTTLAGLTTNELTCYSLIFSLIQRRGDKDYIVSRPPRFGDGLTLAQFIVQWLGSSALAVMAANCDSQDSKLSKTIVYGNLGTANLALIVALLLSNFYIQDSWSRGFVIYFFALIINPIMVLLTIVSFGRQLYVSFASRGEATKSISPLGLLLQSVCFGIAAYGWTPWLPGRMWVRFKRRLLTGRSVDWLDAIDWMGHMGFAVLGNSLIAFACFTVAMFSYLMPTKRVAIAQTIVDENTPLLGSP